MIAPDVQIIDLEPGEWERFSRRCFGSASREIQVLRRGRSVLSSVGPTDVEVPACEVEASGLQGWCDATRMMFDLDRVVVFDADAVAAFAHELVVTSRDLGTQGDVLLRAASMVADNSGIVSSPPFLPPSIASLVDHVRSTDGWIVIVCGDDRAVEWTVVADIRSGMVRTLTTASHVTDLRPPEITVEQLTDTVATAIGGARSVVGTWDELMTLLAADDPLAAVVQVERSRP